MSDSRFKITNTTVKQEKFDSKGNDIRPVRDRVGHSVQFPTTKEGRLVTLYQNKSVLVDDIGDAILKLFKRGYVVVEKISDITEELKKFAHSKEESAPPLVSEDKMGNAAPMGESRGEDKLVNPDGEPNFVAKAPHGGLKKSK